MKKKLSDGWCLISLEARVDFKKLVFQSGGDRRGVKTGAGKVKF